MMRRVLFGAAALLVGLTLLAVPAQGDPEYDPACDMDLKCLYLPIISSPARNPPAPVPKTGQTESRATGDDGDLQKGVAWPDPRFTDNGDGTVTDNLTWLMWAKNANLDGVKTWADALTYCNALSLGGYSDWRLPNVRELFSLLDFSEHWPALPSSHPFTDVQFWHTDFYWSSTTYPGDTSYAPYVHLLYAKVINDHKANTFYVWPVRGDPEYGPVCDMGLKCLYPPIISSPARNPPAPVPKTGQTESRATGDDGDLQKGVAWPDPRFTDNGDGTVTDNLTWLMWAKNANLDGVKTWADALTYCNALSLGGYSDWRLPNVRELFSLLDFSEHWPALPSSHPFTDVQFWHTDFYWSSTAYPEDDMHYIRLVHLLNASVINDSKARTKRVWPVRGGQ